MPVGNELILHRTKLKFIHSLLVTHRSSGYIPGHISCCGYVGKGWDVAPALLDSRRGPDPPECSVAMALMGLQIGGMGLTWCSGGWAGSPRPCLSLEEDFLFHHGV